MVERTASHLKRNEINILASKLGLSEFDIQDISLKYGGNFWRQKLEILHRWRTTYREYATKERLSRVLNEIKGPCTSRDGITEKGDKKNKETMEQRSTSAKLPLRRERTFRSVHLRGSAIQMSPRWQHEKRQHPISPKIKSDDRSPRTSPSTIPEDSTRRYHVTREMDQSSEEETPSSSCLYRGGKLRIQIHLPSGGFTTLEERKRAEKYESTDITDGSSQCTGSSGNESTTILPAINGRVRIGSEQTLAAGKITENRDTGKKLIDDKKDDSFIREEIERMRLKSELKGQCEVENPYVKCTVDSLEEFDGVFVDKVKFKCILLTCRIADIDSLDKIWKESRDGALREKILKALSSLVRAASWSGLVPWEDVRVIIPQEGYIHCRNHLVGRRFLGENSNDEMSEERSLKTDRRKNKNHPHMEPLNQSLRPLDQESAVCNVKSHWMADEIISGWEQMPCNACC